MLTKIGGKEDDVCGGFTGTGAQVLLGVRISSPGCEGRWKRRVILKW